MNADWHRAHVLGSGAPMEARIAWHLEHARECACRPIPASVQQAIDAKHPPDAEAAPSIDP